MGPRPGGDLTRFLSTATPHTLSLGPLWLLFLEHRFVWKFLLLLDQAEGPVGQSLQNPRRKIWKPE